LAWGLHRFGFDPFVAQYSGNSVAAVGAYWNSCAQSILTFEEEHAESCHRIRYEDLVTAPEQTVSAMFDFLGVAPAPGITRDCFSMPHESNGPGDEKIWFTDEGTPTALGRGVRTPVGALPPPLLAARWPTLADQTLSLVVDGEPAERRWSLASAASATAPGQLEGEDPAARLIAGPAVWGSLLGGESNIVTELSAGRLRCVNKRDNHRLRSEQLHAMSWLLGLTQIAVERTPAAVGSERE
jgi:hypothetical protein